jgi:DNA replication protein DnaD
MAKGWIKLHRELTDHWLWEEKPFDKKSAWIDLLLMANHEEKKVMLGSELIDVERGGLITSEVKLADRWGWSRTKIRRFLEMLENDSMIVLKKDNKKTVINIVNFSLFQGADSEKEQQKNIKKTSRKHQKDTNKNEEECIKNEEEVCMGDKPERATFIPPSLQEVEAYCREKKYNIDAERFVNFYESKGWMVGKTKMRKWKAAVANWAKDSKKKPEAESQEKTFVPKSWDEMTIDDF